MATRQLLARATEGTAAPTPGYLYKDLAQAATSNPTACQDMASYLTNRLHSKKNPNIKFKCLKVIAKLCDQVPRNQFRRCISQHPQAVGSIKESLNFRGPLDPVCGDEPNQKVRQAAQEALDAVYRETTSSELAAASSYGGAPSYAPSPHHANGGGGGYGGAPPPGGGQRRMDGIGNPRYQDPRLDPRWNQQQPANLQEAVKEVGDVVLGMIKDPLARNVDASSNNNVPSRGHGELPGYGGPSPHAGRPPPGAAELSRQTGGQWTMASNRGPSAVQPPGSGYSRETQEYYKARDTPNNYQWAAGQTNSNPTRASSGGVGGSWGAAAPAAGGIGGGAASHSTTPSIHITPNPHAPPAASAGPPVSDGSYERNLVLELCPPGGMKAVPPPDKLANFTKVVPSLNSDLVCPVLLDCLEEGQPWIIRAKALCVMETCLVGGARQDGANPYRDFFHACAEEIMPLTGHSRAAIHDPAKRVLALLGVELPAGYAASNSAAAPPLAAAPAPNLLDFDDNADAAATAPTTGPPPLPTEAPPPPPQAPAAAAAQPPAAAASPSLFGGMTVKSSAAPAPTAPAAGTTPAPAGGSLLDFAPQPAAPAPATTNDGSATIFRDAGVTENGSANPPASLFDQMNLKDNSEDKKTDSEDAGDVTSLPSGSAFGFINESNPKEGSAAAGGSPGATTEQHHPPPAPESFDPLKNFSPNTAQKMKMQLSQEQMQAMAYQQMMMQQQMQHQMQMQRAYAASMGQQYPAAAGGMQMPGMPPYGMNMPPKPGMAMSMTNNSSMARPAKKDDKKFDFVKDAMQTETKK